MRHPARILHSLLFLAPTLLAAQEAALKGKVLTDTTEKPIPGVTVSIESLKLQATTDSLGDFLIRGIKPGAYVVTARRVGYGPLATRVRFTAREVVEADFLMSRTAQPLPDVKVETKPRLPPGLIEFEERRLAGAGGRFLTQTDFEKRSFSWTSDVLRQVPSLEIVRDQRRPSQAYVSAGRMQFSGQTSVNDSAPRACFAAVVLDGIFVYQGLPGEMPFDINSIGPNIIAGFEYYVSAASMPAKYNSSMRQTCGLAVIWTKAK